MDTDYAHAKIQSIIGEEFFVKKVLIMQPKPQDSYNPNQCGRNEYVSNKTSQIYEYNIMYRVKKYKDYQTIIIGQLGLLYYQDEKFKFFPFIQTTINEKKFESSTIDQQILDRLENEKTMSVFQDYADSQTIGLETMSKIHFPCKSCRIPHLFYFILPLKEPVSTQNKQQTLQSYIPSRNPMNPFSKTPDKIAYSKWTSDDRDTLKKILMQFGYGRWGQILKQAIQRFQQKTKSEIRSFSNAFIRSLIDLIQQYFSQNDIYYRNQHPDLKQFFLNMIEEYPEDAYIEPNVRDWDLQNLKQKLISVAKRIQLMSRIRMFMKKFKTEQLMQQESEEKPDKQAIVWDQLLCFLPSQTLYSQRPAIWWTRKYDCDLLRGVYKYGYTNYNIIRQAKDLGFVEIDKSLASLYQEFPIPDTLNKRVKKLMQIILKHESDHGKIDFQYVGVSEEEIDSSWPAEERQALFTLLCDFGVPIAVDGRQSWQDLRDRFQNILNQKFEKGLTQLEKMVQNIRITCQQMLVKGKKNLKLSGTANEFSNSQSVSSEEGDNEDQNDLLQQEKKSEQLSQAEIIEEEKNEDLFQITLEGAHRFSKNTNMLHFIRKQVIFCFYNLQQILPQSSQLFQQHFEELQIQFQNKGEDCLGTIQNEEYKLKDDDIVFRTLLQILSLNGFSALKQLDNYEPFKNYQTIITEQQALDRVEFLCTFFKNIRDQQNLKRKSEYNLKDEVCKKVRAPVAEKDLGGELVLPFQVNASLRLLSIGRIIPTQYYHSEHNLFPVGYKSIRTYSSMFNKGSRCQYTCEILEGQDGRPLYKVTSEEDQDNPIIKASCTGCWVLICSKVNDLQDHKKTKVTISGTDRFGLLEPNVCRYLEELPDAEKCQRYKFKWRQDMIQQQIFH